jgi:hypothetical protein
VGEEQILKCHSLGAEERPLEEGVVPVRRVLEELMRLVEPEHGTMAWKASSTQGGLAASCLLAEGALSLRPKMLVLALS